MKAIEEAGIPCVHLCTIVPITQSVGANRIFPSVSIPNPTGYVDMEPEEEKLARLELTRKTVDSLGAKITTQTVFAL